MSDDRTLDEIAADFKEQTGYVRESDHAFWPRTYENMEKAPKTRQAVMTQILVYCGFDFSKIAGPMDDKIKEARGTAELKKQGIEIRPMVKYINFELWKNGDYIFKRDEYIAYISELVNYVPTPQAAYFQDGLHFWTDWKYRAKKLKHNTFISMPNMPDITKLAKKPEKPKQLSRLKKDMLAGKSKKTKRFLKRNKK